MSSDIIASMKAVIFARVSSREQEETGYSLPTQTKILTQYAEKNSFQVIKIFAIAESASGTKERAEFHEMLKYSRKYRVKVIICEKVDRLTRNQRDAVKVDDWMKEDNERQIHFVKSNTILHAESKSTDKFVWNMHVSVAQLHIDNLSEEVKKGNREKIAQGWRPSKPVLGYKTFGESGHKIHIIDEDVKPYIEQMFNLYATGEHSLDRLTKLLYARGMRYRNNKRISRSTIHRLLSEPFYIGKIRWNGQLYPGRQEVFISQDIFDRVQLILNKKGVPRYSKHFFLLRQIIKCKECGGTVTWEIQKGHHYGHCNYFKPCSSRTFVREEKLEEQLIHAFSKLQINNPRINNWLLKVLALQSKQIATNTQTAVEDIEKKLELIEKKIDVLYDDKAEGAITKEFYDRKYQQYTQEKEDLTKAITNGSADQNKKSRKALDIYKLSQKASQIYRKAKPQQKRELIKLVFDQLYLNGKELEYTYTDGFILLYAIVATFNGSKLKNIDRILDYNFEQGEKIDITRQIDTFQHLYPDLLPIRDSNPNKRIQNPLSYH